MDIERMFERAQKDNLFTDFDFCLYHGPDEEVRFSGGYHVSAGAHLFDIASLTKALTHLVWWRLFALGQYSPEDLIKKFLPLSGSGDRRLWHFLSYLVQSYAFDFEHLKAGLLGKSLKEELRRGFGPWSRTFGYDNYASAYLGLALEEIFGMTLEEVFHSQFGISSVTSKLVFHPRYRGRVAPERIVPTSPTFCGAVHDPLSRLYQPEQVSVAGVFSDASTIAEIFHRELDPIMHSPFYDMASVNQLDKCNVKGRSHALGFDIPYPTMFADPVEGALIFSGWTGCRLFFAKRPRITFCYLTNRVFCEDTPESRKRSSQFFGEVVRKVIARCD